jgi:biotin carboxyl carrier protein
VSPFEGEISEVVIKQGKNVSKGDILFKIRENGKGIN